MGNNGLVADGVMIGRMDFEGPGNAFSVEGEMPTTRATLGGLYNSSNVSVEIVFPSTALGNYSWNNLFENNDPSSRSHVKITITGSAEPITLYAVNGSTVVMQYGAQGEEVSGDFSGTLRTEDGQNMVNVDGNFIAIRN